MTSSTEKRREAKRVYMRAYAVIPENRVRQRERAQKYDRRPAIKEQKKIQKKCRRADPATWARCILPGLKLRAKQTGLNFNLVAEDIPVPDVCPVLGIPFVLGAGPNNPSSPSVDRIVPGLGYIKENVLVISRRANILKRDCTDPDELQKVVDYMRRTRPAQ